MGDVAAMRGYLQSGGKVDAQDAKGQSPLQFAAGYGRNACVQLLFDAGAQPIQT